MVQDNLQKALRHVDDLKAKFRQLEERLPLAGVAKSNAVL